MTRSEFEAQLKIDGFAEIEAKQQPARAENGEHTHHFTVRGFIERGEMLIRKDGIQKSYRPGDVFNVPMGQLHSEAYGPEGADIIVGRK